MSQVGAWRADQTRSADNKEGIGFTVTTVFTGVSVAECSVKTLTFQPTEAAG